MTQWGAFAGFAGVVLGALLLLAHVSQRAIADPPADDDTAPGDPAASPVRDHPSPDAADARTSDDSDTDAGVTRANGGATAESPAVGPFDDDANRGRARVAPARRQFRAEESGDRSTAELLLNVAFSQGLFGGLLALGAWYTGVPPATLGLDAAAFGPVVVLAGAGLGVALYVANEVGAAVGERFGLGGSEALRESLAPDSASGWALLLFGVLPVIAAFEELLFRGVLVGAFAAGFGLSPWVLAGVSSAAFAVGHGAQGRVGIAVTGVLGFVLAVAFVLTGSLVAVVVAHYLVNALEFVVHEGLGVEWTGRGGARDG